MILNSITASAVDLQFASDSEAVKFPDQPGVLIVQM